MSEQHTPEPWDEFCDVCEPSTPNPESEPIVRISFANYKRARACVNACAGIPTEHLERCNAIGAVDEILSERNAIKKQRDELRSEIESHAPNGRNFTNGQVVEMRAKLHDSLEAAKSETEAITKQRDKLIETTTADQLEIYSLRQQRDELQSELAEYKAAQKDIHAWRTNYRSA